MPRRWPLVIALVLSVLATTAAAAYLILLRVPPGLILQHAPTFGIVLRAHRSGGGSHHTAAFVLARIASDRPFGTVRGLVRWFASEPDPLVRALIAEGMRDVADPGFVQPMVDAFPGETAAVRHAIVDALLTSPIDAEAGS